MTPVIDITKDLSTLFVQQATKTPDAVALEDNSATYTYAELDKKVLALAHELRKYKVGRDSLVGVFLGRSADYVISCLAALRAGGAFLVLELAYPADLLTDVLQDAKPAVVVTSRAEASKLKTDTPLLILDDYASGSELGAVEQSSLPSDNDLNKLSFVSYSSGTTGRPKGIANPHRAPVLSYNLRFGLSDLRPGDRVACNVFFVWEILRPLLRGATVVCVPDDTSYDPVALVELLSSKKVTETLMTPTLLSAVLSRHPDIGTRLPQLRTLWFNGEVVTTDLARRALEALPNARLLNCYSACETHEIACGDIRQMLDFNSLHCPVGPPMEPEHIYILDENGQRVDSGKSGELYVGGPLLARGYLNLPETTAKAFLPNPFDSSPGARMYKTGDIARLLPSGILEITGRVGGMIKLRGYSVVSAKVEDAILRYLGVSKCVVVAHGDGLERKLVSYVVPAKGAVGRPTMKILKSGHSPEARRVLSPYLAQYMIPALWVELDELPTHGVSGKADLKNLPPPPTFDSSTNFDMEAQIKENVTCTIESLAEFWGAVLNVPQAIITPEQNFFDLGGHSLLLAELSSRLSKAYGFRVPVARLADPATLQDHLNTLQALRDGHVAEELGDLPAILKNDSLLDEDIRPSSSAFCSLSKAHTVLLTGATGFLGAFLLNELLESTSARIVCLVRSKKTSSNGPSAGTPRLRTHLLELGLWRDSILSRIEVLPGNLSEKLLGLTPERYEDLATRIQVIVHAGAAVNLVYPYAALRSTNVEGTREILRLASRSDATVQHVSTNGVLKPSAKAWSEDTTVALEDVAEDLTDGYGQTKWVAEELVREAGHRGMPVRILRAGTISGHSSAGTANASDLLSAIIVESIHLGYAPDIEGWRMEMTPVDFVSKAIIQVAKEPESKQLVFHVGDPDPVEARSVFKMLNELGYATQPLKWDEWLSLWTEKRAVVEGDDSIPTVSLLRSRMPDVGFLKEVVVLDNTATKAFHANLERPTVDTALLETYTRHWYAKGWLPAPSAPQTTLAFSPKSSNKGPLYGKVAVVTGASSGIGAAVAAALAKEGVHVALAARRTDALENVKKGLAITDNKVLLKQTDVTDREQVEALLQAANEELGPVDILVACAGVMYYTLMANVQVAEWEQTVDVNCKGLLHCLSSTVPSMLSRGKGHIVAISSDAGRKVFPGLGVYSASKFFVEATLQSLRLETAGTGLRVTSIQPGNVATGLVGMSTDAEAIKKYAEPSGAKVLDPSDVAAAIVYALRQPEHVAVNEVLIEPRDEPI